MSHWSYYRHHPFYPLNPHPNSNDNHPPISQRSQLRPREAKQQEGLKYGSMNTHGNGKRIHTVLLKIMSESIVHHANVLLRSIQ